MSSKMATMETDVLVVGGGSAGIAAATMAARNGAATVLVDAGPMLGGELNSGIPVDGCITARGDWAVGGFARELFATCARYDGYVGPVCDFRALNVVCIDPEAAKMAAIDLVYGAGVKVLMYTFADQVVSGEGHVEGVVVRNKRGRTLIRARTVIDATGDGDIATGAGCQMAVGDPSSRSMQPVSLLFRMAGVDAPRLLDFVSNAPENVSVLEYPGFAEDRNAAIRGLVEQGLPKVFFVPEGPVLGQAIAEGRMYPTSLVAITPISTGRREVSINTTRVADVDATDTGRLSAVFDDLHRQIEICSRFLQSSVPGFEDAVLSAIAPRIGIRETRRIVGDYVLTGEDILAGRKFDDGVAKGCHELDIHGSDTGHIRANIKDGGSYDIPLRCLIPKGAKNLLVAGRCLSADREAHSSARVMGSCMAMGQAVGTAAAMAREINDFGDVRDVDVGALRARLTEQGAVLEGIV
ncbi:MULTISPECIES: FAD-dependent oxidoreductase [unclassified Roseitalea]|uniref:FAD-dependent oxidoreductase n=1 Tax=unclassified Roseitalea TaxID=2639107 RepID=UPI00273F09AC|nr:MULTISPECIES: FAD-dependent oxidoreductase [unclassified Roseitalea]